MESEKFSAFPATERDGQDKQDALKPKKPEISGENIYNGENGPPILQNMESPKFQAFGPQSKITVRGGMTRGWTGTGSRCRAARAGRVRVGAASEGGGGTRRFLESTY